ncbi:MAG: hypothetical protein OXT69_03550 [Candidatus Poribacteria bacterium]|nr:hypothetical protein [Candidatus Poribacteria bacterium]
MDQRSIGSVLEAAIGGVGVRGERARAYDLPAGELENSKRAACLPPL